MFSFRAGSRLTAGGVAICLLVAVGCDPVQEDRHIQFSQSGAQVAFQHGSDGIFVADPQTGELRKVFDPDPSIIAVSTPIWSGDETQAIFTTARDLTQSEPSTTPTARNSGSQVAGTPGRTSVPAAWDDAPLGRLFFPEPIRYTAWLITRGPNGSFSKPASLFEAHCDHSGYVAGNLAVRWDAKHERILFVDRDSGGGHVIRLFNLASRQKSLLFPPAGQSAPTHVVADFVPGARRVVCVSTAAAWMQEQTLDNRPPKRPPNLAGIWVGSIDGSDWWHIAQSVPSDQDHASQALAALLSQRPAVTNNGELFAFLHEETSPKDSKHSCILYRAHLAEKKVETLFKTPRSIRDLHWSPDGAQLAFLLDEKRSSLKIIDAQGRVRDALTGSDRFVSDFAGWNAAGDKLACVAIEATLAKPPGNWAFLLPPDPLARDLVLVVDSHGAQKTVASGLRFTFPQWSPQRDQLSMWGTFSPSHRALTSELAGGLGLRRGDPAAILDVTTGTLRWLAINGDEMAQVGHYYLIKHDAAQAREWYRKADKLLPKLEPLHPADLVRGLSGGAARRRTFEFFYWYCLMQRRELQEAVERLALFDQSHRIEWPAANTPSATAEKPPAKTGGPPTPGMREDWSDPRARREAETFVAIAKELSILQVFLSLDDSAVAREWSSRVDSKNHGERLAELIGLSQLDLLEKKNGDYASVATDQLAPLLLETLRDPLPNEDRSMPSGPAAIRADLGLVAAHTLAPLCCEPFLKGLPTDFVSRLVPQWESLRSGSHSQIARLLADHILRAAAARLGHNDVRAALTTRIRENPAGGQLALPDDLEAYFAALRGPSM